MEPSEPCSQSKRHSYPVILTYTETLSVLSEHQSEYNRKGSIKRSKTPVLNQNGTEEERTQKLQHALDWLSQELKDMYHQDKFLLRQFNHLNRSIQELKDKKEINEENETKPAQTSRKKPDQDKNRKPKPQVDPPAEEEPAKNPPKKKNELVIRGEFKLEDLKQAQLRLARRRLAEQKREEELSKQEDTKQEKKSLNGYDSDYGSESSDQSIDKYEVDCLKPEKNIALSKSLKVSPKQQRTKRWSWWK